MSRESSQGFPPPCLPPLPSFIPRLGVRRRLESRDCPPGGAADPTARTGRSARAPATAAAASPSRPPPTSARRDSLSGAAAGLLGSAPEPSPAPHFGGHAGVRVARTGEERRGAPQRRSLSTFASRAGRPKGRTRRRTRDSCTDWPGTVVLFSRV